MNAQHSTRPLARSYPYSIDAAALAPQLEALANEIASISLSANDMNAMMLGGIAEFSSLLRSFPVHEGKLLERGIGLLGQFNPDLVVITQNVRLPVSAAAIDLVEKNGEALVRGLMLDIDARTRKTYTPDIILLNKKTQVAHVIDVKRSLSSYETSRITELKTRMLAAALVVPDLLWKEHHRLVAHDVRVVIIDASGKRGSDQGVWPLANLDHLLEVTGAASAILQLRQLFQVRVDANWHRAREQLIETASTGNAKPPRTSAAFGRPSTDEDFAVNETGAGRDDDPADRRTGTSHSAVRFGFARLPGVANA